MTWYFHPLWILFRLLRPVRMKSSRMARPLRPGAASRQTGPTPRITLYRSPSVIALTAWNGIMVLFVLGGGLMNSVRIVADSGCDLPPMIVAQYGIVVIPVYVRFGQEMIPSWS